MSEKILVACERSDTLTFAMRKLGIEAYSVDTAPSEHSSPYHIQDDVLNHLLDRWDAMVAFPECTYLAVSGARWFKDRPEEQQKAIDFFLQIINAPIPKIAVENPIGIMSTVYRKPDQIIQPWQFGHGETKATCLWLKNLPKLNPTNIVDGREHRIHLMAPTKNPEDRRIARARTYPGIADAMAQQWFENPQPKGDGE